MPTSLVPLCVYTLVHIGTVTIMSGAVLYLLVVRAFVNSTMLIQFRSTSEDHMLRWKQRASLLNATIQGT